LLPLALIALLTLGASADEKKEAGAHYQRAVSLYKEGNYQAAHSEFRAAYDAVPSWEVLFNIALCERRLFKYGLAMRTLDQYLLEGGSHIARDRREAVARELEAIRLLTSPVAVIVDGPPARVLVDGEPIGTTPLQELVLLGPGTHRVRAERDGCTPDEQVLEVRSGQARSVQLRPASLTEPVELTLDCSAPFAEVTADGTQPVSCPGALPLRPGNHELVATAAGYVTLRTEVLVQPGQARKVTLTLMELPPRPRPFPVTGVSLMGAGVVAGGVGLAFALMASADAQRMTSLVRSGGPWDQAAVALQAEGQRNSALGWVFLGLGSASLAAGVVALVLQVRAPPPVTLWLAPRPGGFAVCGGF
jgi:PEGA domain